MHDPDVRSVAATDRGRCLLVEIWVPDHDVHRDAYVLVLVVEPVHQLSHRRPVPTREPVPERELHGRSLILAAAARCALTDDRRITRTTTAPQEEQPAGGLRGGGDRESTRLNSS